ncbi:MAG: surface-adhesin E family protein [Syntrophorhabdus sp.]
MKKRLVVSITLVACVIILACTVPVSAQTIRERLMNPQSPPKASPESEWKIYLESDSARYYFSPASVQRVGKIARVWEKITTINKDQSETDKIKSLIELDCSSSKYRIIAEKEYDPATGQDKPEAQINESFKYFSLESILGVLYDNVCYQGGVKVTGPPKAKKDEKKDDKKEEKKDEKK